MHTTQACSFSALMDIDPPLSLTFMSYQQHAPRWFLSEVQGGLITTQREMCNVFNCYHVLCDAYKKQRPTAVQSSKKQQTLRFALLHTYIRRTLFREVDY